MSEFESVERKLRLLEKHYRKDGRPFTITGREWVKSDLFIPVEDTAFKLWPRDPDRFDKSLLGQVGMLVEWTPELVTELATFEAERPGEGLRLVPIMLVVLNLERGAGKTVNTAGLAISNMASEEDLRFAFVASAKKQTAALLRENYLEPIEQSAALAAKFELKGDVLTFPRKGQNKSCTLEMTETSHSSITGRRRNRILIEEARDVDARTFAALLPSIRAGAKLRCPHGHQVETYVEDVLITCRTCKMTLIPRIPKLVVTSTSGVLEGGEYDWFDELVESLTTEPNGYAHLLRDGDNPALAKVETDMMSSVFGKVTSLSTYLDVEMNNRARRKGTDFVAEHEIKGIFDSRLTPEVGSEEYCFAFLDTSRVGDLTSLVVVVNDSERDIQSKAKVRADGFRFTRLAFIKTWNPKDARQCPKGYIDRADVEAVLCDVLWQFPNMIELLIDVRGSMAWAVDMLADIRAGRVDRAKHCRYKVKAMAKLQGVDRNIAWGITETRIKTRTFRSFPFKLLEEELKGVRAVKTLEGQIEIRDRDRKVRHADVLEGVVQCLYRIHKHMVTPRVSMAEANGNPRIQTALKQIFSTKSSYDLDSGLSATDVRESDL